MILSYPDDKIVVQLDKPGETVLQVSVANKVPHLRECGGQGRCTTCRVRILDGIGHVSERTSREARMAEERGWDRYTRLACQTRITGDVTVQRLVRSAADVSLLQADALQAEPGQEVQTAILICDIRQFTPFVDGNLPHDVYHILNRFFGEIGEPILLNNGYIYQYIGDQIIGLFGLQGGTAQEACQGAVRAGLGMMSALKSLNEQIEEEFGVRLDIRIGAHYGPLVVGYMGHPTRRDFSVVGDAINVASRIESTNEILGTTFLASSIFHEHLATELEPGFQGDLVLKGKEGRHALVEVRGYAEPDSVLLVQDTARYLLGDQEQFGEVFYRRLFEAAPAARAMFKGHMGGQGRMLAHTLQMAVYGLSRFEAMVPGLVALAQSHIKYGVVPEHFDLFRQIFLATTEEILGKRYNADVEQAWGEAIDRISHVMRKSMSRAASTEPATPQPETETVFSDGSNGVYKVAH
ncbi:MAG TPA: adenylate/guanylate cyclase domain-containing protein [Rhodothermales bacterium]|nr:adenylate/guanylate cyclase domain-containing protein [Rhodothermales bacterium]